MTVARKSRKSHKPQESEKTRQKDHQQCRKTLVDKRPAFFRLPSELRLMIFRLVLPKGPIFHLKDKVYPLLWNRMFVSWCNSLPAGYWETSMHPLAKPDVAVLGVSKQFHDEASQILYGERVFASGLTRNGITRLQCALGTQSRRVRRLMLVVNGAAGFLHTCGKSPYWLSLLAGMDKLYLIFRAPRDDTTQVVEDEVILDRWRAEVILLLEALHGLLPSTTRLYIDNDGPVDASKLSESIFPRQVKFLRTHIGNELYVWRHEQSNYHQAFMEARFRRIVECAFDTAEPSFVTPVVRIPFTAEVYFAD